MMITVPRTMSTQHPDNARIPFFTSGGVMGGEDEILEAYLLFSQFGCQEQMWDFEGKKALPWVISELLAKDHDFFEKRPLGKEVFLTFENPQYHVQINREKKLVLCLKTNIKPATSIFAELTSDHPEIVVKGGGKCGLHETDITGVLQGQCIVLGRQLKAKGNITAQVEGFEPAQTRVEVVEKSEPPAGIRFKKAIPTEKSCAPLRYQWDNKEPNILWIDANHPSIRKYLKKRTAQGYLGESSPLYHAVLAEVVAEALAFDILLKLFKREGQEGMLDFEATNLYYHQEFSAFLTITHKHLVTESPDTTLRNGIEIDC